MDSRCSHYRSHFYVFGLIAGIIVLADCVTQCGNHAFVRMSAKHLVALAPWDNLQHYIACQALWSTISRVTGSQIPTSMMERLALYSTDRFRVLCLALAYVVYHTARSRSMAFRSISRNGQFVVSQTQFDQSVAAVCRWLKVLT